jgi:hypothetical protein
MGRKGRLHGSGPRRASRYPRKRSISETGGQDERGTNMNGRMRIQRKEKIP